MGGPHLRALPGAAAGSSVFQFCFPARHCLELAKLVLPEVFEIADCKKTKGGAAGVFYLTDAVPAQ
jgi:hypothetical protein